MSSGSRNTPGVMLLIDRENRMAQTPTFGTLKSTWKSLPSRQTSFAKSLRVLQTCRYKRSRATRSHWSGAAGSWFSNPPASNHGEAPTPREPTRGRGAKHAPIELGPTQEESDQ
jgi:hypothetical protein